MKDIEARAKEKAEAEKVTEELNVAIKKITEDMRIQNESETVHNAVLGDCQTLAAQSLRRHSGVCSRLTDKALPSYRRSRGCLQQS